MAETSKELEGPDLSEGVAFEALREGEPLLGHAGGERVVLVKRGAACFAVGATCTHYSGPLAEGLVEGETIRCPWHHARFDLTTGAAVGGPGLAALPCYDVVRVDGIVRVAKARAAASKARAAGPERVVIVGSGAAGTVVATTLRREGYAGAILLVGDEGAPMDRPNLSKDFLSGTAPEEWLPLRDEAALRADGIELVTARVTGVDVVAKTLAIEGSRAEPYDALVLATGAEPARLSIPGHERAFVLRTLADARAILLAAASAKRAVVVGGGFIGLEVAASLRARGLDVSVVMREEVPLARVLGDELGRFVAALHREHGVSFVRGTPASIDASGVTLEGGAKVEGELVVAGVGVRPRVELAKAAGLRVEGGVVVDDRLRTSAPDVYAVGDVASFPRRSALARVEHWVHAERMGFVAARNLLGHDEAFTFAPFFWSQHYDVPIAFVGGGAWDAVEIVGEPAKRDVLAVYKDRGAVVAVASIFRDLESLRFEALFERDDAKAIDALLAAARAK